MLKVIAACGSGMGSSMMIKMKLQKVFKSLGVEADIHHTNAGEAKSIASQYHMIVCSESLKDTFAKAAEAGVAVVPLRNLLDEKEITEKLAPYDFAELEKRVHA
ncbi:MAG: PTS sugar transporter subunit IIB [Treponema sp.]|nr:PTS sugar transporter subunit IIB [Treponema sp.]